MMRVTVYSLYQRIWHWTQAVVILLLIASGLKIHLPDQAPWAGFYAAVELHNVAALVLLSNAVFGLFYYLATGEIRQLIPQAKNLFGAIAAQGRFYTQGIFRGEAHPFTRQPGNRLNPLQRIIYVMILNVLLPLQGVTGILIWGAQSWPDVAQRLGGLRLLAGVHALGAWLFCAFLLAHLYLITTGRTPAANLQTMFTGWEEQAAGVEQAKEPVHES
jgi:thiosulfate reductase cytochrome b subunit